MDKSAALEEGSGPEVPQISPADYVVVLPNQLNKYGERLPKSFNLMVLLIRNLLAAKLRVSWYVSTDRRQVFIRVSADHDRLVQEAERTQLLMRKQTTFREVYDPDNETFIEFDPQEIHNYFNCFQSHGPFQFTSLQRQRLVLSIMTAEHAQNGAQIQEYADHITEMFPMHDRNEISTLLKLFAKGSWRSGAPVREIRDYWGEELGLYYAFISFLNRYLLVLAVGGLAVAADQFVAGYDTLATPLYALGTQLLAVLIMDFWIREENTLKSQWNVENFEELEATRPEFKGQWAINPVSGIQEYLDTRYTTGLIRVLGVLLNGTVSMVGTAVCLAPTIARSYLLESWGYLGVGITAAVTFVLVLLVNGGIKRVSAHIVDLENHRTETDYKDSLILKTFVYQFFPTYGAMFWTALIQESVSYGGHTLTCGHHNCFGSLGVMLAVHFSLFLLIDNVGEVLHLRSAPLCGSWGCVQLCAALRTRCRRWWSQETRHAAELDRLIPEDGVYVSTEEETAQGQHAYHGPLAEYNELFMQYGFVMLFAPAFPLVALMAAVNNMLRLRIDGYKLCRLYRRPLYKGAEDIGSWMHVLRLLSVLSVLTNALIVVYSNDSLARLGVYKVFGDTDADHKLARLAVCLTCEHVVLLLRCLISEAVPSLTDHVLLERKRRSWEAAQEEAARLKLLHDDNLAYVVRQRVNEAPDRFEHHIDDI